MNDRDQYLHLLRERTRLCYKLLKVDQQFQQVQLRMNPSQRPFGEVGQVGIEALPFEKAGNSLRLNMDRRYPPDWHSFTRRLGFPVVESIERLPDVGE